MRKIVFITPVDARYGFSLAGVTQLSITPTELRATVEEATGQEETGVVVVDERLMNGMSEDDLHEIESRWTGVIIVLPAPETLELEGEAYAMRLLRRAIGYHVRLNA
ncbi:MAG: V-type ATP synthase subunit F [bacterium]|nr:V-type ATP synthase subunit F [bacterium]